MEITSDQGGGSAMWSLLWVLTAVLLGVAEFFTLTLAFALLSGAALVAAVAAGLGAPVLVQVLAFATAGAFGLLAVRPVARRHLEMPPLTREGADALVGRQALVTQEVTATHGLVHLAGEDWSARSYVEDLVIPVGARVDVLQIAGATALVLPRDPLPEAPSEEG